MRRRIFALILALFMLSAFIPATASAAEPGIVRVKFNSIGSVSSLDLKVSGSYSISGQNLTLSSGQSMSLSASGSSLTLRVGSQSYNMGSSFTLSRLDSSGLVTVTSPAIGSRSYRGDFTFYASSGSITVVNSVYIEDYLVGVAAYEMGNDWPMEALKAQVVAARTYVYMYMGRSGNYDIGDTASDQVYKGYNANYRNVISAVEATKGQLLTYNGAPFTTYYAASNGGETDTPANVWTDRASPGCYVVKQDPYDAKNADSLIATVYFTSRGTASHTRVESLIKSKIASLANTSAGSISITSYLDGQLTNPKYSNSINYRTLNLSVMTNVGQYTVQLGLMDEIKPLLSLDHDLRMARLSTTSVSSMSMIYLDYCRYGHGVGLSQRGAQQMANEGMNYQQILSFYYENTSLRTYEFTNTASLPASNPGDGQIVQGDETPQLGVGDGETPVGYAYVSLLNAPTYYVPLRASADETSAVQAQLDHGAVVLVYGQTGNYYNASFNSARGYVNKNYVSSYTAIGSAGTSQTQPAQTPASTPAALNLSSKALRNCDVYAQASTSSTAIEKLSKGETFTVTEISGDMCKIKLNALKGWIKIADADGIAEYAANNGNDGGSSIQQVASSATAETTAGVNLREGESTNSKIITTISKGKTVTVVSRGTIWSKVTYSGKTGYINNAYLKFAQASSPTTPGAGSSTAETSVTVNMRSGPGTGNSVIRSVPGGQSVTVISRGAEWSQVSYSGSTGYIINTYLRFGQGSEIVGGGAAAPSTTQARTSANVNLRESGSTSAKKLTTVPGGDTVNVIERGSSWSKVSYGTYTGYIMNDYLRFTEASTPTAPTTPTTPSTPAASTGKLTTTASVNLRKEASADSEKLTTISSGKEVEVIEKGSSWTKVRYNGMEGYVSTKYLNDASAVTSPDSSFTYWKMITTDSLTLRKSASTSSESLATIPKGVTVNVLEIGTEWSKLIYGTNIGYVMTQYLVALPA